MSEPALPEEKSLLILDDDRPFRERLARAMQARGFDVKIAETVRDGIAMVKENPPAFAVIDLKLDDGNGLDVVESLHETRPSARVVVLTGFGNIATAVAAVKFGAIDYLSKPADADDILGALLAAPGGSEGRLHLRPGQPQHDHADADQHEFGERPRIHELGQRAERREPRDQGHGDAA